MDFIKRILARILAPAVTTIDHAIADFKVAIDKLEAAITHHNTQAQEKYDQARTLFDEANEQRDQAAAAKRIKDKIADLVA